MKIKKRLLAGTLATILTLSTTLTVVAEDFENVNVAEENPVVMVVEDETEEAASVEEPETEVENLVEENKKDEGYTEPKAEENKAEEDKMDANEDVKEEKHTHSLATEKLLDGTFKKFCTNEGCDYYEIVEADADEKNDCEHTFIYTAIEGEEGYHLVTCEKEDCKYEKKAACTYEDGICIKCGSKEPVVEHHFEYKSNENGTHDVFCIDKDCTFELETKECEFGEDGICKYCGYEKPEELVKVEKTFEINGTSITVSGNIPENAEISVKETYLPEDYINNIEDTLEDGYVFSIYEVLDITIYDKDGNEWQPVDHGETISITVSSIEVEENTKRDDVVVYRVSDEETTELNTEYDVAKEEVTFETEHFTIYAIGSVTNGATYTFTSVTSGKTTTYTSANKGKSSSTAEIDVNFFADGEVSIPWTVSSEERYDHIQIYIDGVLVLGTTSASSSDRTPYSGVKSGTITKSLSSGNHILKAKYIKDSSGDSNDDCATFSISFEPTYQLGSNVWGFMDGSTGTFYINGTGDTYTKYTASSWSHYANKNDITKVIVQEGVTSIGSYMFNGYSNLSSIELPSTITSIGSNAFMQCTKLSISELPSGLTTIENNAFRECTNLALSNLPNTIKKIGTYAFYKCTNLVISELPYGLTTIDRNSFYYCTKMTEISIPSSVTSIGDYALPQLETIMLSNVTLSSTFTLPGTGYYRSDTKEFITSLTSGTTYLCTLTLSKPHDYKLGDNVWGDFTSTGIGAGSFYISGTGAMYDKLYSSDWPYHSIRSQIKEVSIADGVTSIGNHAFEYCENLTSLICSDSVTKIGDCAFNECAFAYIYLPEKLTTIGDNAFGACLLKSINIPNTVTSIGNYAFSDNANLTSATLPSGLTQINNGLFMGCSKLNSVNIPDSVKIIGDSAFRACKGLTSITLPNGLTTIGGYTFQWSGLKEISIPSSVTSIGSFALHGCNDLSKIVLNNVTLREYTELDKEYYRSDTQGKLSYFVGHITYNCTLTIDPPYTNTFTVTIPLSLELTKHPTITGKYTASYNVSAVCDTDKTLKVAASNFTITNSDSDSVTAYTSVSETWTGKIESADSRSEEVYAYPTKAGTYSGTMRFTISLE